MKRKRSKGSKKREEVNVDYEDIKEYREKVYFIL